VKEVTEATEVEDSMEVIEVIMEAAGASMAAGEATPGVEVTTEGTGRKFSKFVLSFFLQN
jgi:hypothetical protein